MTGALLCVDKVTDGKLKITYLFDDTDSYPILTGPYPADRVRHGSYAAPFGDAARKSTLVRFAAGSVFSRLCAAAGRIGVGRTNRAGRRFRRLAAVWTPNGGGVARKTNPARRGRHTSEIAFPAVTDIMIGRVARCRSCRVRKTTAWMALCGDTFTLPA